MTNRIGRRRSRALGVLAAGVAATLTLSGCTLIQELQTLRADETTKPTEGMEVIDGNLDAALRPFYEQSLDWGECGPEVAAPEGYECATATAPMDWGNPEAHDDVELALVRLPATGEKLGSMFTNPGGPGSSGVSFVAGSGDYMFSADLREHFDIIGWDPRGVGLSSAVECVDDAGMDEYIYGVPDGYAEATPEERLQMSIEVNRKFGEACLANTGDLLGFVDTKSTVNDLDLLRALMGDTTLTYFGFSYGTDIGAQYIDAYPERVGRIVLDGATDPTVPMFDVIIDQQEKFGDSTRNYLADCLTSADCPFAGQTVDQAIESIKTLFDEVDATLPVAADGRTLTSSVVSQAIVAAMYDSSSWPYLSQAFSSWYDAADSSVFFLLSDFYYGRDMNGHYDSNMFEAFAAINCLDYPLVTDKAVIKDFHQRLSEVSIFYDAADEAPGSDEIGDITCENWPVPSKVEKQEPVVGAGAAPVLVVATTNDPATPLKWAEAVAEQLESGVLLEVAGDGHIAYGRTQCGDDIIDDYFITGAVPEDGKKCDA